MPHAGEIEMLEDVEHLDQLGAAAGRRIAGDTVAAIGAPQRLSGLRLRAGDVRGSEQRPVSAHVCGDLGGNLAFVEVVGAARGDARQRPRHVGVLQVSPTLRTRPPSTA